MPSVGCALHLCLGEDAILIFTLVFNIEYQNAWMKKETQEQKALIGSEIGFQTELMG